MKLKKRTKASRIRGARTFGWGFRQKHKGHGNSGGYGLAGSGKRADHKKQMALKIAKKAGAKSYFGRAGHTSRRVAKLKIKTKNLSDIQKNLFEKDGQKIDLKKYKILGMGDGFKAIIEAKSASVTAIEKMKKAGGEIIIAQSNTKKGTSGEKDKKEEKPEVKKDGDKKSDKKVVKK